MKVRTPYRPLALFAWQRDNAVAYTVPDTPYASITPGQTGIKFVPINRMTPRSFITNIKAGATIAAGASASARGIAFGGDTWVAKVEFSADAGKSWQSATLGKDEGKYSFRQWAINFTLREKGPHVLMVRCTNSNGVAQPDVANWNPSGFMRNVVETTPVTAA